MVRASWGIMSWAVGLAAWIGCRLSESSVIVGLVLVNFCAELMGVATTFPFLVYCFQNISAWDFLCVFVHFRIVQIRQITEVI